MDPILAPLIKQAIREKKWLRSNYQGILFSPRELMEENKNGKFLWGPVNWTLVNPNNYFVDIPTIVKDAEKNNAELTKRINEGWIDAALN